MQILSFPASRTGPTWQIARTTLLPAMLPQPAVRLRSATRRASSSRASFALRSFRSWRSLIWFA
jgi:hypothetical protein